MSRPIIGPCDTHQPLTVEIILMPHSCLNMTNKLAALLMKWIHNLPVTVQHKMYNRI